MTDREAEAASKLLTGALVFATNSREGFTTHYPTLGRIPVEEWNALLTVAGAGTALLMLPARFEADEQKELTATVVGNLHDWDSSSVQSLANLINFVTAEAKDSSHLPDLIGSWVLRNVDLEKPEHTATHVLGTMLVNTFAGWWDQ